MLNQELAGVGGDSLAYVYNLCVVPGSNLGDVLIDGGRCLLPCIGVHHEYTLGPEDPGCVEGVALVKVVRQGAAALPFAERSTHAEGVT
jgi:hypothetical protein